MNAQNEKDMFRDKCKSVASQLDLEDVGFFFDEGIENDAFEDDGFLHVRRFGVRACFAVGQDLPASKQNEIIRSIMAGLGFRVTSRVLVGEDE